MRFHVIGLPHTNTTAEYENCAYTEKIRKFCNMMKSLDHEIFLYGGTQNEAEVTEFITCMSEEDRLNLLDGRHFLHVKYDATLEGWQIFNSNVINAIKERLEPKDFICFIAGSTQVSIANEFPNNLRVEYGIGYGGTFAPFRVFESEAWRHSIYAMHTNPTSVDGNFYDDVIPGYLEPERFPLVEEKEDYYLYIGRLISRKGIDVASQVCEYLGKRLIIAGVGDFKVPYGEYIGPVYGKEKAELMGKATAVFCPTYYIEPFANVHVEAQVCGTPVITTPWGVYSETVINGFNGYKCHNLKEFAKATEDVKNLNPRLIHERAVELYSVDNVRYKYDTYFKRLYDLHGKGWYQD